MVEAWGHGTFQIGLLRFYMILVKREKAPMRISLSPPSPSSPAIPSIDIQGKGQGL